MYMYVVCVCVCMCARARAAMAGFVPDKQQHSQSTEQFLREIEDDFAAPSSSRFQEYIPKCRKNIQSMEEVCVCVCVCVHANMHIRTCTCTVVRCWAATILTVVYIS